MHFAGDKPTWTLRCRDGGTFALYVRDALAITTPTATAIPPLTPPVPRADLTVPAGFAADWDRWWTHVLGSGRTAGGAEHGLARWPKGLPPRLRDTYADWRGNPAADDAHRARVTTGRAFGPLLNELVQELEEELGRPPAFTLELIELPVQGQFWRRLDRDTALVSTELLCSRNLIAPLESVIRELEGV